MATQFVAYTAFHNKPNTPSAFQINSYKSKPVYIKASLIYKKLDNLLE